MAEGKGIIVTGDNWLPLKRAGSFIERAEIILHPVVSNLEALELHYEDPADMIIADLDSPSMGALEMCQEIRDNYHLRDVSIIVISPGDSGSVERAMRVRANEVLARPVNTETLLIEIQRLLSVAARAAVRMPIAIRVQGEHRSRPFIGRSLNISSTGMLLEADTEMGEGDIINCTFMISGGRRVTLVAEVVRVLIADPFEDIKYYGLQFSGPSPDVARAIESFIDESVYRA